MGKYGIWADGGKYLDNARPFFGGEDELREQLAHLAITMICMFWSNLMLLPFLSLRELPINPAEISSRSAPTWYTHIGGVFPIDDVRFFQIHNHPQRYVDER